MKRNYLDLRTKPDLPSKASRLGTFGILENTEFTVKAAKDRVFYNVADGCSRIWILDMFISMCPKHHLGPPPLLKIILISLLMIQRWLT